MAALFQQVLRVSLFTAPVILLLLLLMPRLGRRYSPRLRCLVWIGLTARLLLPFPFSAAGLLGQDSPLINLLEQIDQNAVAAALSGAAAQERIAGLGQAGLALDWNLMGMIWFSVLLVFLCCNIIVYHMAVKRLQRWSVPVTDPVLLRSFEEGKRRLSISRNIELYQTGNSNPPMIIGFLHPRIYIPAKQVSSAGFADIISHELWHDKRKDLWLKLALLLAAAVHWFNPIVFFMLRQVELDIEIACDNDVLRGATASARRQYGLTILASLEEAYPVSTPLTTTFSGGKKQMKVRFSDIINPSKKKSGIFFITFVAVLMIFCSLLANNDAYAAQLQEKSAVDDVGLEALPGSNGKGEMAWPVPGFYQVSSGYGKRYDGEDFHIGMDISGEDITGAPVIAAETGTVVNVATDYTPGRGYGKWVIIKHEGTVSTLYAMLDEILVKTGDKVEKGQVIAKAGSTGSANEPHLHFEVREGAAAVDPTLYLMPVEEVE